MRLRRKHLPIPRVEVLDLRPNDRLVLEYDERITMQQAEAVREQLSSFLDLGPNRVLVVCQGHLRVLREGAAPPPPVLIAPAQEARGI